MMTLLWQARVRKTLLFPLVGALLPFALAISCAAQRQSPSVADKTFAEVNALLARSDYQGAKIRLRSLEVGPHLSQVQRFNIGWLYGKAHDFSDALRIFNSVEPDVPDRLTHGYAIALSQFESQQFEASAATLIALRSQGIFDAKCADLLGVSFSKLGRYQEAYAVMAEDLRQNPANPFAYFNLITLFVDTQELDKAAQIADEAVSALPQNAEALMMRGLIELTQSKTEDAYSDFRLAAKSSSQSPDPPFFMALTEYRESKFNQAVQVLKQAIASGIVDSDLHYLLAECLLRVDGPDPAAILSELDTAIELNPRSVSARILRGERLLDSGRAQAAIVDLKIARELDPNPQRDARNATYLLARAYVAEGKKAEAKVLLDQLRLKAESSRVDELSQLSDRKMRAALHQR